MKLKNQQLFREDAYIDGRWVGSDQRFKVRNPANGQHLAAVADLTGKDAESAIEAAARALPEWSAKSAKERAAVLLRWRDAILENADDLAALLTAEMGKSKTEAKGEIIYGASFIEWFAEEAKRAYGDIVPSSLPGTKIFLQKQPVGVCAMITPWNFPNAMITRKAAPALAAGCTAVIKPAEQTPLSALALAALAEEAGIPHGVLNVVPSSQAAAIGEVMCYSETVRKVSFTGSTGVGKILMRQCADTVKKLSLELGGNAPFIVFDDADIDAAVAGAIACKFRNSGQTCVSSNRFYVQDGVYKEFAEKFSLAVQALKVGAGHEEGVDMGPVIDERAVQKVQQHVADAVGKGAKITVGGDVHSLGGSFFQPTVLCDVTEDMLVAGEETFGPLAPLFRFSDEDDVIRQANATRYGLASYLYSKDMRRIWNVVDALEFGMVAVNTPVISTEASAFGGIKESGLGTEGSKYGLDEYLETKSILLSGLASQ